VSEWSYFMELKLPMSADTHRCEQFTWWDMWGQTLWQNLGAGCGNKRVKSGRYLVIHEPGAQFKKYLKVFPKIIVWSISGAARLLFRVVHNSPPCPFLAFPSFPTRSHFPLPSRPSHYTSPSTGLYPLNPSSWGVSERALQASLAGLDRARPPNSFCYILR